MFWCDEIMADDGEVEELSAEEKLLQKHRRERKEFIAKVQSLKHGISKGNKKQKKEVTEEIAKLELELNQRHEKELAELQVGSQQVNAVAHGLENSTINGELAKEEQKSKANKVSKAQRRRDKRVEKEKEREQLIAQQDVKNLHSERHLEAKKIKEILGERNLQTHEIPSDGNCLYMAVIHQVKQKHPSVISSVQDLRREVSEYMIANAEEFMPFLSNQNTGEPMTKDEFLEYCHDVAQMNVWGGQVELQVLTCILKCPIEILQADGPIIKLGENYSSESLLLTYHRHAYGLGEHYNSVIPAKEEAEDEFCGS